MSLFIFHIHTSQSIATCRQYVTVIFLIPFDHLFDDLPLDRVVGGLPTVIFLVNQFFLQYVLPRLQFSGVSRPLTSTTLVCCQIHWFVIPFHGFMYHCQFIFGLLLLNLGLPLHLWVQEGACKVFFFINSETILWYSQLLRLIFTKACCSKQRRSLRVSPNC